MARPRGEIQFITLSISLCGGAEDKSFVRTAIEDSPEHVLPSLKGFRMFQMANPLALDEDPQNWGM